ncbi:MAG: thiamine phosphate synthase [Lachnospiraceae bacterium]|nr:thiamine phosphate synthase [Lachnospiraceae bacterium]
MDWNGEKLLLYAVTDRAWTKHQTLIQQIESALKGGVTCVQLREKELEEEELIKEALKIGELCKKYQVPFLMNDRVDIAMACNADGVHLGQGDMGISEARKLLGKDKIIGATAKNVEQAKKAEAEGADYLGVGAVFGSTTKKDAIPITKEQLREITASVSIPVVAIGGINRKNIFELSGTGIYGVAVVSGIFAAEDIEKECRLLCEESRKIRREC